MDLPITRLPFRITRLAGNFLAGHDSQHAQNRVADGDEQRVRARQTEPLPYVKAHNQRDPHDGHDASQERRPRRHKRAQVGTGSQQNDRALEQQAARYRGATLVPFRRSHERGPHQRAEQDGEDDGFEQSPPGKRDEDAFTRPGQHRHAKRESESGQDALKFSPRYLLQGGTTLLDRA